MKPTNAQLSIVLGARSVRGIFKPDEIRGSELQTYAPLIIPIRFIEAVEALRARLCWEESGDWSTPC